MRKAASLFATFLFITGALAQNLPNTILWQVTKQGNKHTSYLFGTFHEVSPLFFDSLTNTVSKLAGADILFVEQKQNVHDTLKANTIKLWTVEKWRAILTNRQDSIFKAFTTKADDSSYYKLPPLLLSLTIARLYLQNFCNAGTTALNELMDHHIENVAIRQNKQVYSLDASQTTILKNTSDSFNSPQNTLYASYSIGYMENMLNEDASACTVMDAYKNFAMDYALDTDLTQVPNHSPLLIDRNNKWVSVLHQSFLQHNCFVAVGIRHLFYMQGLIQQLKKLGYKVIPVAAK